MIEVTVAVWGTFMWAWLFVPGFKEAVTLASIGLVTAGIFLWWVPLVLA